MPQVLGPSQQLRAGDDHLRLFFNDIAAPAEGLIHPMPEHVVQILSFGSRWPRSAPLVVHCWAGISRSTAAAYMVACALAHARSEGSILDVPCGAGRLAPRLLARASHVTGIDLSPPMVEEARRALAVEVADGRVDLATGSADALAMRAVAALLEIQVIQARHIAESDEAAMTRMEAAMAASQSTARKALDSLKALLPPAAGSQLAAAGAALDRFTAVNAEIITLSRRNSNVRSLALSLGRKRTVTAECDDMLQALEDTLAKHHFAATR